MSKIKPFIYTLLFAFFLFSCTDTKNTNHTLFSGKITNPTAEHIVLINVYSSKRDTIKVKKDGSFSDTINAPEGTYLFTYKKIFHRIFLQPGHPLIMNFDTEDFNNTLKFLDSGAEINKYLLTKLEKQRALTKEGMSVYDLDEKAYKAKIKKEEEVLLKMLSETTLPKEFKAKEKRNIHYGYLTSLNRYPLFKARKDKTYEPSDKFLDELNQIDYTNEEDFLFSSNYRRLVQSSIIEKASDLAKKNNIPEDIAFLKVVNDLKNETIKNKLLFQKAEYGITYTDDLDTFYQLFMKGSSNKADENKITVSYNKLLNVSKGKPSPQFVDYENYKGGVTSLTDLKGKYVYVDVWATWCGPCRAEIPYLKKIEEKFHGKNIHFLSVSIDKPEHEEKWRKMIEEEKLGGIQVLADNAWKSQFVQDYLIKGIPRFILIDPNGNIVDFNAPRPSDPKLIDLFNSLNI